MNARKPKRAVIIHLDGRLEEMQLESHKGTDTYEALTEILSGSLESIPLDDCEVYVDGNGKAKKLAINPVATEFCQPFFSGSFFPSEFLVGTCVVVGRADRFGNCTHLSKRVIERLRRLPPIDECLGLLKQRSGSDYPSAYVDSSF